ncbi:unnamed protein product [Danaus chrysippus]|uniref:(African queen) hypothetical protein n=1 Tax=Danaus chrysippus TaxID=151541 RepID=A0A8J2QIQ8_9NEOP|nr:unnamed protein product [Danaus chrysippus]
MTISRGKLLFGTCNTILFCCGFAKVVCGFLLLSDSKRILLSRLLVSPDSALDEPPFYYLSLALLATGLTVCAVSALGVWATYLPGYAILTIYFLLIVGLLVCECAGGAAAATWPRCVGGGGAPDGARGGAVGALQGYYAVPDYEHFTTAVDLAQTELKCCGMTGARNYDLSSWQLRRLGPRGLSAPLSCCVQRAGGSFLDPAPLNGSRCQEVTENEFRHSSGCLSKIEEWYQEQYLVFMLSLFSVVIFKLVILLSTVYSCIHYRKRRQDEFIIKADRKSMSHEPITAKYVQPNNYYSPRVRNPRLFRDKPNEMV